MKPFIQIRIRSKVDTFEWRDYGWPFIESLVNTSKGWLSPEHISTNPERFKQKFESVEACEDNWAGLGQIHIDGKKVSEFHNDFAWRRKNKLKGKGWVTHKMINQLHQLIPAEIDFKVDYHKEINWFELFRHWCGLFSPQLAMLHFFTEHECKGVKQLSLNQLGSFGALIKPQISKIGWGMYYGDEFAKEVDVVKLQQAGFHVEQWPNGYLVTVTDCLNDVEDDFKTFSHRQSEMRNLFRDEIFATEREPEVIQLSDDQADAFEQLMEKTKLNVIEGEHWQIELNEKWQLTQSSSSVFEFAYYGSEKREIEKEVFVTILDRPEIILNHQTFARQLAKITLDQYPESDIGWQMVEHSVDDYLSYSSVIIDQYEQSSEGVFRIAGKILVFPLYIVRLTFMDYCAIDLETSKNFSDPIFFSFKAKN
ncbi:hypothetical protein [Acinetobacter sp. NIPH 298]|uniref:hypothetical protein n=1 Tax=Acinetobacter sp. NIPH 298 TaxID=1217692 RepID=UPI0002D0BFB8|nr:hypothetical protein [Acinetobacter sp. NIPH 298]ENW94589.1 hypothetical protein F903_02802 [Acinetobacter sp. NIPH 298]